MRKATYVITGESGATAELAVTAFPGDVGGEVANVGTGARWSGSEWLVVEADESDGTFLVLGPRAGIVALVGALSVGALTACALIGPTVTSSTTTNYDPIEFSSAARTCLKVHPSMKVTSACENSPCVTFCSSAQPVVPCAIS